MFKIRVCNIANERNKSVGKQARSYKGCSLSSILTVIEAKVLGGSIRNNPDFQGIAVSEASKIYQYAYHKSTVFPW